MKVSAITTLAMLKTRLPNKSGGSTGSGTLRTCTASQAPSTTASTLHTCTCGESQAHSVPPSASTSSADVIEPVISTEPR